MRMRRLRMLLLLACVALGLASRPEPAAAQTPFVPYFGKIPPRYDQFDWHIYKTDHFEIYYYPALEQHLERVASYAESAYQHISADLKHDLATRVPLILFKTRASSRRTTSSGGETPEGVLAFAEPEREPDGAADRRAAGPAVPADHARTDAHLRVRHHPARV